MCETTPTQRTMHCVFFFQRLYLVKKPKMCHFRVGLEHALIVTVGTREIQHNTLHLPLRKHGNDLLTSDDLISSIYAGLLLNSC